MLAKCCGLLLMVNLADAFDEDSSKFEAKKEKPKFFTLEGVVASENFSRYELKFAKPMRIVLESLKGDADIYISYTDKAVSYELDKHDISSTTCGIDYVDVVSSPEPVYLGVYGHPSKNESSYRVLIIVSENGVFEYGPEVIHRWGELNKRYSDEHQFSTYMEVLSWILDILVDILSWILEILVDVLL